MAGKIRKKAPQGLFFMSFFIANALIKPPS